MRRLFAAPAVVLLSAVLQVCHAEMVLAQGVSYSVVLGAALSSWSGPFVESGQLDGFGSVAAERRLAGRAALRGELGAGPHVTNLGDATALTFNRAHLAALARIYASAHAEGPQFFVELGAMRWLRTACDVDMAGGPSFFGGETVDCEAWEPSTTRPLRPNSSGTSFLLSMGGYRGRFGLTLRYYAGGRPVIATSEGPIHVRDLVLAAEWAFNGRR